MKLRRDGWVWRRSGVANVVKAKSKGAGVLIEWREGVGHLYSHPTTQSLMWNVPVE